MPDQRFITLPDGRQVPAPATANEKEIKGLSRPEFSREPPPRRAIPEQIVESEQEPEPAPESDVEDLSDMFETSVDRESVQQGIKEVTEVTEEDAMGEPMGDLFEVDRADIMGGEGKMSEDILAPYKKEDVSDLTAVTDEDMEELTGVDDEDIMGEPDEDEKPEKEENVIDIGYPNVRPVGEVKRQFRKSKKIFRPYIPPPSTSLGGIR